MFRDGSNYDHHFIFKEFVEGFEGQFECLRKNTEVHSILCNKQKREWKRQGSNIKNKIYSLSKIYV